MKKKLLIILILCLTVLTACKKKDEEKEKYRVYEWHYNDIMFDNTDEIIAKYDDEGNLMYLEVYKVYDYKDLKIDDSYCERIIESNSKTEDSKHKGVKSNCIKDGSMIKISYTMTNESIEDGYLTDANKKYVFSDLQSTYSKMKDEEQAKKTINELIDKTKNENITCDEKNYAVINGQKECW